MKKIDDETINKGNAVLDELSFLKTQHELLIDYLAQLSTILDKYPLVEGVEVEWVPIDENSEINSLTFETIDGYIHTMIKEYMEETNSTQEEAEKTIHEYCPQIFSISKQLMINPSENVFNTSLKNHVVYRNLKYLRLPKYKKKKTFENMNLSDDLNALITAFYYQQKGIETLFKVSMGQLNMLMQVLGVSIPNDTDEQIEFSSEDSKQRIY